MTENFYLKESSARITSFFLFNELSKNVDFKNVLNDKVNLIQNLCKNYKGTSATIDYKLLL